MRDGPRQLSPGLGTCLGAERWGQGEQALRDSPGLREAQSLFPHHTVIACWAEIQRLL